MFRGKYYSSLFHTTSFKPSHVQELRVSSTRANEFIDYPGIDTGGTIPEPVSRYLKLWSIMYTYTFKVRRDCGFLALRGGKLPVPASSWAGYFIMRYADEIESTDGIMT